MRKENALRRLIANGGTRAKLLSAALVVRDARIAVLRAKQNQNPERNVSERAMFLQDEESIERLRAKTSDAILAEFLPDSIASGDPTRSSWQDLDADG